MTIHTHREKPVYLSERLTNQTVTNTISDGSIPQCTTLPNIIPLARTMVTYETWPAGN